MNVLPRPRSERWGGLFRRSPRGFGGSDRGRRNQRNRAAGLAEIGVRPEFTSAFGETGLCRRPYSKVADIGRHSVVEALVGEYPRQSHRRGR